ncbi:MAG: hypothetical protein NC302_12280 [Bacteroidales bacterium]|nr:hypothetical protein [Bacteroidales bacterium]MCM1416477.1 hypothetical protein [bacterium]MCM1424577.1 hypothetical protein [bacterium]
MKNRENAKSYALIVVFVLLFFLCMVFCGARCIRLARDYQYRSLSYRMETAELEERMYGVSHIFSSLYFSDDHEEEFDEYWDFCDAYLAYVRGRFAGEKAPYIETLRGYLDTAPGGEREKAVRSYLEELERR